MNLIRRNSWIRINSDNSIELNYNIKDEDYPRIEVTSTAPIVMFGGKRYIWLNREECQQGQTDIMNLLSEYGHDMALPFDCDLKRQSTDLADALPLLIQYDQVAFGECKENELELVIPYLLSSEDDYSSDRHPKAVKTLKLLKSL